VNRASKHPTSRLEGAGNEDRVVVGVSGDEIDGVRAGNVVAFGVEGSRGKEAIVVVAESNSDDPGRIARHMGERVIETLGVPAKDIVLVGGGTLPKTSSGKLQRSLCRALYSTDAFADVRWHAHSIKR